MNGAALGALFAGAGREGRASNEGQVWTIEAMGGRGLAKEMVAALRREACRWRIGECVFWSLFSPRSGGGSGRRRFHALALDDLRRAARRRAGVDLGVGRVRARMRNLFDGVSNRGHGAI